MIQNNIFPPTPNILGALLNHLPLDEVQFVPATLARSKSEKNQAQGIELEFIEQQDMSIQMPGNGNRHVKRKVKNGSSRHHHSCKRRDNEESQR